LHKRFAATLSATRRFELTDKLSEIQWKLRSSKIIFVPIELSLGSRIGDGFNSVAFGSSHDKRGIGAGRKHGVGQACELFGREGPAVRKAGLLGCLRCSGRRRLILILRERGLRGGGSFDILGRHLRNSLVNDEIHPDTEFLGWLTASLRQTV
jgi:hypothetical protein